MSNIGDLHYIQKKFNEAQTWYERAISLSLDLKSQPLVLYQSLNLGNALFAQIINLHKEAPVAVGVVGEAVSPWIVKNNIRNVKAGYINDDTLRDYGLINPSQFFFKK